MSFLFGNKCYVLFTLDCVLYGFVYFPVGDSRSSVVAFWTEGEQASDPESEA